MGKLFQSCLVTRAIGALLTLAFAPLSLYSDSDLAGPRPVLLISRVEQPPKLEDYLDMKPSRAAEGHLAKVEGFSQYTPKDGEPATQPTHVFAGYDSNYLYVIFIAFDSEPGKLRARMTRRENIMSDDLVFVSLDTFHDQLRSYEFWANPLGIQLDARWTEAEDLDTSFDTLWRSRGQVTDQGYVVWMAIPFKSLRFPSTPEQIWGISFWRKVPRLNEITAWPHISTRIDGELNQAATLRGMKNISPGGNLQLIPYGFLRSFRALDTRDPDLPRFVTDRVDPDMGLDAKFVFKDSFALDVAVNPDFSQVESDEPQTTVNQRFEVFFPEKRPFFLENADFFRTPINLFFSRRIADPQFGVRLTGKKGPYSIGALVADDEAPGKSVPATDTVFGKRARLGVFRVNRDVFRQSTLGLIYTDREFAGGYNRVGGLDGRLKMSKNWVASFQGVTSSTEFEDGSRLAGPAYDAQLQRRGRQFFYYLNYKDRSPGFRTLAGFDPRPDIRSIDQFTRYSFRPEGKRLISWGPGFKTVAAFDHSGTRLDLRQNTFIAADLVGQTHISLFYDWSRERLRPQDFEVLPENRDFSRNFKGFYFQSSYIPQVNFKAEYSLGTRINFVPPEGQEPFLVTWTRGDLGVTLRPINSLRIDNTYILDQIKDRSRGASIFNNHIVRTKWNWQFNRELSLRVILQYDAVLTNPQFTALETSKNFNADFLFTYRVNPWTALYFGYNGNLQNIDLLTSATSSELLRTRGLLNDARQFFVKFSYLLRF